MPPDAWWLALLLVPGVVWITRRGSGGAPWSPATAVPQLGPSDDASALLEPDRESSSAVPYDHASEPDGSSEERSPDVSE